MPVFGKYGFLFQDATSKGAMILFEPNKLETNYWFLISVRLMFLKLIN